MCAQKEKGPIVEAIEKFKEQNKFRHTKLSMKVRCQNLVWFLAIYRVKTIFLEVQERHGIEIQHISAQ